MKLASLLLGLLMLVLGTLVVLDVVHFTEREEVLRIGGLEASIERERRPPDTVGIVLIALGAGLAVYGLVRRR